MKPTIKIGTVLLIEDDQMQADVITIMLNLIGWRNVIAAKDGREALEKVRNAVNPFRVIVTDWNMPVMDGIEFINNLRQMQKYDVVPVVLITVFGKNAGEVHPGKEKADSLLFKPITPDSLDNAIQQALEKRGG